MPKGKPENPPDAVYDYWAAKGFPLREYLKTRGIKPREAAEKLKVPESRFSLWVYTSPQIPWAVYEYMVTNWGEHGFGPPKKIPAPKRFVLDKMYEPYLGPPPGGLKLVPKSKPPEPKPIATLTPLEKEQWQRSSSPNLNINFDKIDPQLAPFKVPTTPIHPGDKVEDINWVTAGRIVPWEMYKATVELLMEQSARLLAEKILIDQENRRLTMYISRLEADRGLGTTMEKLSDVEGVPTPPPTEVLETIRTAVSNGAVAAPSKVIADLERRIPKSLAPRP